MANSNAIDPGISSLVSLTTCDSRKLCQVTAKPICPLSDHLGLNVIDLQSLGNSPRHGIAATIPHAELWLHMQRAFFPVEVGVLGVLHLCITHTGIQEQTIKQFFLFV